MLSSISSTFFTFSTSLDNDSMTETNVENGTLSTVCCSAEKASGDSFQNQNKHQEKLCKYRRTLQAQHHCPSEWADTHQSESRLCAHWKLSGLSSLQDNGTKSTIQSRPSHCRSIDANQMEAKKKEKSKSEKSVVNFCCCVDSSKDFRTSGRVSGGTSQTCKSPKRTTDAPDGRKMRRVWCCCLGTPLAQGREHDHQNLNRNDNNSHSNRNSNGITANADSSSSRHQCLSCKLRRDCTFRFSHSSSSSSAPFAICSRCYSSSSSHCSSSSSIPSSASCRLKMPPVSVDKVVREMNITPTFSNRTENVRIETCSIQPVSELHRCLLLGTKTIFSTRLSCSSLGSSLSSAIVALLMVLILLMPQALCQPNPLNGGGSIIGSGGTKVSQSAKQQQLLFDAFTSSSSPSSSSSPPQNPIKIGALFAEDEKDGPAELAFKYAVYRINKDRTLLPNRTLVYDIEYVPREDSFHASRRACSQLESGANVIFGPQDTLLGGYIQSLCDALDIPHIEARLDLDTQVNEFSINLYPSPTIVGRALRDLIHYLNWTKIAVIYEDDVSLIKMQELVKPPLSKRVQFIFRKGNALSFRDVLLDVRSRGVYSLIIDTKPESLPKILSAILQTQMNNYKYHYHFMTFDIETYDLENFRYNFVNMTAFRMVDSEHPSVRQILRDIEKYQPKGHPILNRTNVIQFEPALIFDSVYVFARGLQSLDRGATLRPGNVSCDAETPWRDGSSLFNYINSADVRGLTGRITFKEGKRNTLKVDLLKLKDSDLIKVGEWSTSSGLNVTNHNIFHDFGTTNITLRVTTILSQPYVLRKKGAVNSTNPNDQFEGFCIDLLKAIAEMLNFQYELYLVPDGKYGAENQSTGEWNGLVREIIDKNADLAVASMTINYARESVIHFTKPYMNLGIGILFKLPSQTPTLLFSFMSPLDVNIWLYVLAAYIVVSITMFIVARFSPAEWRPPHPCLAAVAPEHQQEMENQFSMANAFWFTIVTLMHQGCDLNPKAASTRIIGAIWWFFTLILVSSYTANLAAFLTVERMITPIENVEDLATQSKIAYGTLESGSTMTFFRDSQIETYQKMWRFMENRPSVFVKTYDEGVQRVIEGNYAFLMESTMLDFKVQRNCNLTQIGGLLDSKGYGIATPIGSPWRDKISLAILHLQEKGIIRMLYDRWWKRPGITCSRDDKSKESKANALGVENIGGVFVVLLGGLAVAIVTAFIEFCINSRKNAHNLRQSLCAEMSDELKIAVKCHVEGRQRPALKRKCSKCVGATDGMEGHNHNSKNQGGHHGHPVHHGMGQSSSSSAGHHHTSTHQPQHHQDCRDSNCSGCLIRMNDNCKCDSSAYVPDDPTGELYATTKRSETPNQTKMVDLMGEQHSRYENFYSTSSKTNLIHRRSSPSTTAKNAVGGGGQMNSSTNCIWSLSGNNGPDRHIRPESSPPQSPLPPPPPPPVCKQQPPPLHNDQNGNSLDVDDDDDDDAGMLSADDQEGQLVIECDQDIDDLSYFHHTTPQSNAPIMMMMLNGTREDGQLNGRTASRGPGAVNIGPPNGVDPYGSCHRPRTPNIIHQFLPLSEKNSVNPGMGNGNNAAQAAGIVTVHPVNGGMLMLDKSAALTGTNKLSSGAVNTQLAFSAGSYNAHMASEHHHPSIVDSELMAFNSN